MIAWLPIISLLLFGPHAADAKLRVRVTDGGTGKAIPCRITVVDSAGKLAPLVPQLREFALRPDTPVDDEVKAHIVKQLDLAAERFRAILG